MSNYFKSNNCFLLVLLFAILTLSCAKDVDLYDELSRYEEPTEEVTDGSESDDTEESSENEDSSEEDEAEGSTEENSEEENEEEDDDTSSETTTADGLFVTPGGSANNDGSSESNALSLTRAFEIAKAGDIFYVKSGNYGDVHLKLNQNGTQGNPIKFIGYRNTPGDIEASNSPTITYDNYKNQNDEISFDAMPTIYGTNQGRTEYWSSGIWIENRSHVEIRNFQISQKARGILVMNSNNIVMDNIVAVNIGINGENASGRAIHLINADDCVVENSLIVNAGTGGILLETTTNSIIRDNKVFSDNFVNSLDYYIFFFGESSDNLVQRVHIERINELPHTGHGLGGFQGLTNTIFEDFTIINSSLELSYASVNNNIFRDFSIRGNVDDQQYHYSIQIANGANNNLFENFTIENGNGIQFLEWDRGDTHATNRFNEENAGRNNTFRNGVISKCNYGIVFHHLERDYAPANDNLFSNMVFKDLNLALFAVNRNNFNNTMVDSRLENIPRLLHSKGSSLDFNFENTELVNINFDLPN